MPNHNEEQAKAFYRQELNFFALEKFVQEIGKVSDSLKLDYRKDTIALILDYPVVGFDPSVGYKTTYMIFGPSLEKGILGKYKQGVDSFKRSYITNSRRKRLISNYEKTESGCETGYLILLFMSPKLKLYKCHSALGIGLTSGNW